MSKELKVLVTAYDYRPHVGGVATCAYETIQALSRINGVKVKLITYKQLSDEIFDSKSNFETLRFNMSRRSYIAVFQLIKILNKEINIFKPHVILNFLWNPSAVAAFLSKERKRHKIPYAVVVHGVELLETNCGIKKKIRKAMSFVKRIVLKNAYRIFPVSNFTGALVKKITKSTANIKVIYNGVNSKEFYPQEASHELMKKYQTQGKTVFLSMTRIESYKGIDKALEAFKEVAKINKNFKYIICGDGSDSERIQNMIKDYNLQDYVSLVGAISFAQRRNYYNLSDCFILLSRFDQKTPNVEGFGLVFLEAAACAKPSIAGNSGGVSDAVLNQKTGWLVEPENISEIKQAILECIEAPAKRNILSENAYKHAVNEMSWENVADKIFTELNHVRD
ncbi:MAG: glycosyltransferase family 4 protein [Oligoflexia bacterium]|nr:glycosyltransferase family 4 protein [Oligoflexia bacterium]